MGQDVERRGKENLMKREIKEVVLHQFHCDFSFNLGESSFPKLSA
jgi:hypothetical protein